MPHFLITNIVADKGHYARNKATHLLTIKNYGVEMHRAITTSLQSAIDALLEELPGLFSSGSDETRSQIDREIKVFFEQNSTTGIRTTSKKVISASKVKLQNSLDACIESLMNAWSKDVSFEPEEVIDLEEIQYEDENRYNIGSGFRDEDGDEDYEGSDSDWTSKEGALFPLDHPDYFYSTGTGY